jgi:photosystem II stability/assembly factor-like uncharacterized protein
MCAVASAARLCTGLCLLLAPLHTATLLAQVPHVPPLYGELTLRSIGPAVTGGRIDDVEAVPGHPATVYVATATGGLWKSDNDATTWTPIFDQEPVSTFGVVALAPSNPDVIWAGTGEQNNRQSTSWGDGVYRSTDGGRTWTHLGLEGTLHIGRIVVDPRDADVAYVAAQGDLWAASPDRGVFKTTDGGRSWKKVLYVDTLTGATDLALDPQHPDVVYAATYQRLRRAWGFNGGGPGSGLWKSTDAGATWTRLTGGLPKGPMGRIGLTMSAQNPAILEARIEHATEGGIYRTEDGGRSWEHVNSLNPRPAYYGAITIDPTDASRVYVISEDAYVSEDGGRHFREIPTRPSYDVGVHSDHHAMWIDPANSEHFFLAGDGGLYETWDRGRTFTRHNNIPIAQLYALGVDGNTPYNIYMGLQDDHSWMGPSATRRWIGIINDDWKQIGFGDGTYQQPDPTNDRYVYSTADGGGWTRVDTHTGDILQIRPEAPAGEPPYRWDWDSPGLISPHDPRTIYLGANRLLISHDRGLTWQRTPDLTKHIDRDTLRLMGVTGSQPMLSKNDGTSSYGEITSIAESPVDANVLWVGTDDGNIQVSRDAGKTWTEVSRNVPRSAIAGGRTGYISRVTASHTGPGVAYVAVDDHRDGDFAPYVFKTSDFGAHWTALTGGLAPEGTVNDVIEHPSNPALLFLGTEHTLYVSINGGALWQRFGANLPTTLYEDLLIEPRSNDLVVGTHGRSVWILDDVAPLVEWSSDIATQRAHVFSIRPATLFQYRKTTSYRGHAAYAGSNPPFGAVISYYLAQAADSVSLVIRDATGATVRTLEAPGSAGVIHRIAWDLRHGLPFPEPEQPPSRALPVPPHPLGLRGPLVAPGTYTVSLEADGATAHASVLVQPDPDMPMLSDSDYAAREAFSMRLLNLMAETRSAVRRATELESALQMRRDSLTHAGRKAPRDLAADLDSVGAVLRDLGAPGRFGGLSGRVSALYGGINGSGAEQGSLYPPTPVAREEADRLEKQLTDALARLDALRRRGPGTGDGA